MHPVKQTVLALFFLAAMNMIAVAQPKSVSSKIEPMKRSGLYVFANGEGPDEASAKQNGKKNLVQLIKLQYGVPENAGVQKSSDELEEFRPVSKTGSEIVTEEFTWTVKKVVKAVVFTKKEVARTIAISAATRTFRDEEEFVFGEFSDPDPTRAANEAKANLIAQIQQRVESDRSLTTEETRTTAGRTGQTATASSESFKSQSRVFSRMSLQGLKTIPLKIESDHYVFAYITKPDIEKSFEPVKQKITGLVQEGEQQIGNGNIALGASALYRAYILCDGYFTTLPYTFQDGKRTQDVRTAIESKILALIDSVDMRAAPAYDIDERNTVVPFTATYRGKPLQGFGYIFEYGGFTAAGSFSASGNLMELNNYVPESRQVTIRPKVIIDIRDQIASDEMLADLAPSRILAPVKELNVDFSNLFKFQVSAEFEDLKVKFIAQPRFPGMIKLLKWDFGDGSSDTRGNLYVYHTYDEKDVYKVRVWANGDQNLQEERFVDFSANRLRMQPPKGCKDCSPAASPVETVVPKVPEYNEMAGIQTTQGLFTTIQTLSKRGKLVFGNQKTIGDAEGALVFVVDERNVVDRLIFSGNRYFQVSTKEPVENLAERYSGKRLIWVKLL